MPTQGAVDFDIEDPLGADMLWTEDLDATHRLESGLSLLAHDIFARITTPRGKLIDDPDYGISVIDELLCEPLTRARLAALPRRLEVEILKDPRVHGVRVKLTQTDTYSFRIDIAG